MAAADDVWLRKRLVEELPSRSVSMDVLTEQMRSAVVGAAAVPGSTSATAWRYQVVLVPWQRQIGPSCGLAALRMARDHFVNAFGGVDVMGGGGDGSGDTPQMPSLLREAQERGYGGREACIHEQCNLLKGASRDKNHLKIALVAKPITHMYKSSAIARSWLVLGKVRVHMFGRFSFTVLII